MSDNTRISEVKKGDEKLTKQTHGLREMVNKNEAEKTKHENKNEAEKIKYENKLFKEEEEGYRKKINELTYNAVHDAIGKFDRLKELIGYTRLQEQDITKMRAFQHKDGRILLGSIEHVTKAFEKYGYKANLDDLEVGKENNDIKRINIDEGLIGILKDRGFKADIAKRGTDGELEKVGTVHGTWNKEKEKMDVTFEEYKRNQSDRGRNEASRNTHETSIQNPPDGDHKQPPSDGTGNLSGDDQTTSQNGNPESVVSAITIEPVVTAELVEPEATEPAITELTAVRQSLDPSEQNNSQERQGINLSDNRWRRRPDESVDEPGQG